MVAVALRGSFSAKVASCIKTSLACITLPLCIWLGPWRLLRKNPKCHKIRDNNAKNTRPAKTAKSNIHNGIPRPSKKSLPRDITVDVTAKKNTFYEINGIITCKDECIKEFELVWLLVPKTHKSAVSFAKTRFSLPQITIPPKERNLFHFIAL